MLPEQELGFSDRRALRCHTAWMNESLAAAGALTARIHPNQRRCSAGRGGRVRDAAVSDHSLDSRSEDDIGRQLARERAQLGSLTGPIGSGGPMSARCIPDVADPFSPAHAIATALTTDGFGRDGVDPWDDSGRSWQPLSESVVTPAPVGGRRYRSCLRSGAGAPD